MSRVPGTMPTRPCGFAARLIVVLVAAATLAGCGKKAMPQPPAGQPITYPQAYPHD